LQDKNSFRKVVKARKGDHLTVNEDRINAEIIVNRYLDSEYFKKADIIFAYSSMKDEIPTERIVQTALKSGKKVALPKVISSVSDGAKMEFLLVDVNTLYINGVYGIMEPESGERVYPVGGNDRIEILIPGLCFDLEKNRIGYGGGYYDRYLSQFDREKFHITALAYEYQIFEVIPSNEYDSKVDLVITEKRWIE
jgi:5-formyltetrahydrofolate cyclo-ligase